MLLASLVMTLPVVSVQHLKFGTDIILSPSQLSTQQVVVVCTGRQTIVVDDAERDAVLCAPLDEKVLNMSALSLSTADLRLQRIAHLEIVPHWPSFFLSQTVTALWPVCLVAGPGNIKVQH